MNGEDISGVGTLTATDVVADSVSTEKENTTTAKVGHGGYPSIQSAHDALPPNGGRIEVTEGLSETGITLSKVVVVEGGGAVYQDGTPEIILDTSGGDGIHIQEPGCTIRDLQIHGDGTSYGVRDGVKNNFSGRTVIENVSVRGCQDGFQYTGGCLGSRYDVAARNCTRHGHFIDMGTGDYFNANLFQRLVAHSCLNGITAEGGSNGIKGNAINNLWIESTSGDHHIKIADTLSFENNHISGYGLEGGAVNWGFQYNGTGDGNRLYVTIFRGGVDVPNSVFAEQNHRDHTETANVLSDGFEMASALSFDASSTGTVTPRQSHVEIREPGNATAEAETAVRDDAIAFDPSQTGKVRLQYEVSNIGSFVGSKIALCLTSDPTGFETGTNYALGVVTPNSNNDYTRLYLSDSVGATDDITFPNTDFVENTIYLQLSWDGTSVTFTARENKARGETSTVSVSSNYPSGPLHLRAGAFDTDASSASQVDIDVTGIAFD
jgi:hypothetical protein